MSSANNPVMAPAFGAAILACALAKEGCKVIGDLGITLCEETSAFLTQGSTLGANALKDLASGITGNMIHGVKDGATIFGAMVGGVEVMFQRCGQAIIGISATDEDECISADIAENISKRYAEILNEIAKISTATDEEMINHLEKMEGIKLDLALTTADHERISNEMDQLKQTEEKMIFELEKSNKELEMSGESENLEKIKNMIASMNESIEAMRIEISANDLKLQESENSKIAQAENLSQAKENQDQMEQRQKEGEEILELHDSRIKEYVKSEIQRITTTDNPFVDSEISVFEDENGNTQIRIEETN